MIDKEPWKFSRRQNIPTAWIGLEEYMTSIIKEFNIKQNSALEFGVDYGYSADILSQLFKNVTGVDLFEGDSHIIHEQGEDFYNTVKKSFEGSNVDIIKSSFEDFILNDDKNYDLIHIDIVHLYEPTRKCAEWAVQHSNVVMLHDTISFPEIHQVCVDVSAAHNLKFYNIPEHHGLGILVKGS